MAKKGALELSVSGIVVLILAIAFLGLGLGFVKGMFGKVSVSFEEQISREPEPASPTADFPITLSRENIKTNPGETEVIKIAVLNPTGSDWIRRDFLYHKVIAPYVCGASDRVCYVDTDNGCDGSTDLDCAGVDNKNACADDGICLVNEQTCPDVEDAIREGNGISDEFDLPHHDDCGPQDGIDLLISCDNELKINKVSEPKTIPAGEVQNFMSILDIKKGVKGSYLCKIIVFGNNAEGELIQGFTKDLIIEAG